MNTISSLLKFIANTFNTKTYTPTITLNSDSKAEVTSSAFRQRSGVMSFTINSRLTDSVPEGQDIMTGTISGVPLPASSASAVGYYGNRTIVIMLYSGGSFVMRNASTVAMTSGSATGASGCYVANRL